MNLFQEVKDRAVAPGLGSARIVTDLAVLVRQLRDSCPRVRLDVLAGWEKKAMEMRQSLLDVLDEHQQPEKRVQSIDLHLCPSRRANQSRGRHEGNSPGASPTQVPKD